MHKNKLLSFLLLLTLLCALLLIGCTQNDTDSSTYIITTTAGAEITDNEPISNDSDSTLEPNTTTDIHTNQTASNITTNNTDISDTPTNTDTLTDNPTNVPIATDELHCTISINCSSINEHLDDLDEAKTDFVPIDGWLLEPTEIV